MVQSSRASGRKHYGQGGVVSILDSVTIGAFNNQLHLVNNGAGQNTITMANSTVSASEAGAVGGITTVNGLKQDFTFLEGSSSVAATVNASGSGTTGAVPGAFQPELWVVANGGSGVINGGAQAILAFSSGNGVLSVDGGTAVGEAAGFFKSGSGGGAIMASNPLLATTLVGGGNNDVMFGIGNNTTMIAGAGSQTEASFASGGETFEGNLGSGASTITMETFISGGNQFITGNGVNNINALGGATPSVKASPAPPAACRTPPRSLASTPGPTASRSRSPAAAPTRRSRAALRRPLRSWCRRQVAIRLLPSAMAASGPSWGPLSLVATFTRPGAAALYRTGRNTQLNIKARAPAIDTFYAIADDLGVRKGLPMRQPPLQAPCCG
jgi:hypothetical protein